MHSFLSEVSSYVVCNTWWLSKMRSFLVADKIQNKNVSVFCSGLRLLWRQNARSEMEISASNLRWRMGCELRVESKIWIQSSHIKYLKPNIIYCWNQNKTPTFSIFSSKKWLISVVLSGNLWKRKNNLAFSFDFNNIHYIYWYVFHSPAPTLLCKIGEQGD